MSHRGRSNQDRGFDDDPRSEPRGNERSRRREPAEFDDEPFDLPAWGTNRPAGIDRDSEDSPPPSRQRSREQPEPGGRRSGRRDPFPTLGDAFRRPARRSSAEMDDPQSSASTRDPYDRLRRGASKPQRPVSFDDTPAEVAYTDSGDFADVPETRPAPRERRTARREATATTVDQRVAPARTPATQQLGGLYAAAGPQARILAAIGGFAVLSLVFMSATTAGRMNAMPEWMPIHLNAEGVPDLWGSASTLWRIPLMAVMFTLMNATVAWYLWQREAFAARFILSSTVLVHALCWIALINLAW